MGLYVHLYVNRHNLTPESWEQVYQESLYLLDKFPLPLHRTKTKYLLGQKRYVYTTQLVEDEGTLNEHWAVEGDLLSDKRAEVFYLYRYPWRRNPEQTFENGDKHILWADKNQINSINTGSGYDVFGSAFGSKTQGYPYHLAMLAVGILVENRFQNHAFVNGDIDQTQTKACIEWMNTVLEQPVKMPICLDAERLYTQLQQIYTDPSLVIARFKTLSCDTEEIQLKTLFKYADKELITQYILNKLQRYTELSQSGAIKLISQYLTVTQDIQQTIELVLQARQRRPEFSLEALLTLFGSHFVTIEPQQREPLNILMFPPDDLKAMKQVFTQICSNINAAAFDFYISHSELLKIFTAHRPSKRATFEKILTETEQQCHTQLALLKTKLIEIKEKVNQVDESISDSVTAASFESYSAQEAYIVEQAYLQKERFLDPNDAAKQMAENLSQIIQENTEFLTSKNQKNYLEKIYYMSHANGFALSEQAWQQIDNEENLDILQRLLTLSVIKSRDNHFWQWRRYFMEHANLWETLLAYEN